MDFDLILNEYERNLSTIENTFSEDKFSRVKKIEVAEKELSSLDKNINMILHEIDNELQNKYISYAIGELYPYLKTFNIAVRTPNYCGNDGITKLISDLEKLYENKARTLSLIAQLKKEIEELSQNYEAKRETIIKAIKTQYEQLTENITVEYDLRGNKTFNVLELPHEILIGNVIKHVSGKTSLIAGDSLRYPLYYNLRKDAGIILQYTRSVPDDVISRMITALAIKTISAYPHGTIKLGIINFVSHPCINALNEGLSKSKISLGEVFTDKKGIDQLISVATQTCIRINSKLLQNDCEDIFFLYENGIKTEQFQFIIIKGALRNIDEANLRTLYSWIESYAACGIKFILADCFDETTLKNKSQEFGEILEKIKGKSAVFSIGNSGIIDSKNRHIELLSLPDSNTDRDVFAYCNQYMKLSNGKREDYISYEKIGFGIDDKKSDDSIYIPIAFNAPNVWNIEFHCTSKSPLANLIVGISGTGKSRLIDAMILNGAIKYSPDELIFHLLDFKDGLSSDAYLSDCRIPHVKVVSRENKAEEANIILSSILQEKEERATKFKYYKVSSIAGYNQCSTQKMPRLIIVIDECQHIFDSDDLTKKCEQIVREGRAAGIHLVLATQAVSQQMMRTIKFVDGRYCFELANQSDAEQLLNKECAKRLSEVNKSSHKAFVTDFSKGDCEIIKIEPAFDGDFDESRTRRSEYARRIREKWNKYAIDVFEVGNQEPYIVSAYDFMRLRHSEILSFYIGINYQNRADINFCLDSEGQSAVFICSSISTIGESLLSSIILQGYHQEINMRVVNATGQKKVGNILSQLAKSQNIVIGCESDYTRILEDVYSEYLVRSKKPNKQYEPILFVVNGLQNILEFKNNIKVKTSPPPIAENPSEEMRMSFSERREARRQATMSSETIGISGKDTFFELLGNSYRVGIHICCSIDSVNVTNTSGQLFSSGDRNIIKQCRYKILDGNAGEEVRNIMENSFKEKMLMGMNENICFISERQRNYYKAKYLQFASSSEAIQQVLSKEENV